MTARAHMQQLKLVLGACMLLVLSVPLLSAAQEPERTFGSYSTEGVPGGDAVFNDFVVGPGKIDVTIKPGESKTVEMIVTNRTGELRIFNVTMEDAQGSRSTETAITLLGEERGPYSLKDYISVPYESFELGHNQRATIPVTISVPPDAEPGGLYGSVLIDTVTIEATPGDFETTMPQSALIARIGTLFFVTIPGETERDASLVEFGTLEKQRFFTEGPITFGLLHENNGTVHIAPYGEIRIHNIAGAEVGSLELEPWFVLPQSVRLREITWNRDFLFGRYTATVAINRSYDDIVDEMSFTFWVLPWKPIAGGFAILFLIIFALRAFFKRFEFKRKDTSGVSGGTS
jgi:hypothetical protein